MSTIFIKKRPPVLFLILRSLFRHLNLMTLPSEEDRPLCIKEGSMCGNRESFIWTKELYRGVQLPSYKVATEKNRILRFSKKVTTNHPRFIVTILINLYFFIHPNLPNNHQQIYYHNFFVQVLQDSEE